MLTSSTRKVFRSPLGDRGNHSASKNYVGVNVVEKYEWGRVKDDQQEIEGFIQSPLAFLSSSCIKTESILRAVSGIRLFRLVRCGIAVPKSLRAHFSIYILTL